MNDLKAMLVSDIHLPYHNERWLAMWFDVLRWYQPDDVQLLGDISDGTCVSRWVDGTPGEYASGGLATEAPVVRKFFEDVREVVPNARIHFADGNHDFFRTNKYLDNKAPALKGLITPETLWGIDTLGFEYSHYDDPPQHWAGDVYVHHGPYAKSKSGDSVRAVLEEFNVSCVVGHSHRQGYVAKTFPLAGTRLRGWELGHMTDITSSGMAYTRNHDWQAGFATATLINGNDPHLQLVGINEKENTCVVDGKVFYA